ncbi:MAG TPA: cytochrome c biogenesis protein DipZ [Bacteroidota bacterium]|nr:cytochrome c biogenesis protein DipZ [Bacteroidota bacterium]
MILLLAFAFLAGLVTILAPCIWPILPIVLSSSVAGKGHQRPLGITLGIMASFGFFTLAISYLVNIFHFDPNGLRLAAVIIIAFLGLTMIIPSLSSLIEVYISRLSGVFGHHNNQGNGFGVGFITGLSLGMVWSPCAGPILAAIATLAATGKVTLDVVMITFAYVLGTGIPLFLFAYGGQHIIRRTRSLSEHLGRIQQAFGVMMLLTALAIQTNYDKVVETKLLELFPVFGTTLNAFESNHAIAAQLDLLKGKDASEIVDVSQKESLLNADKVAPDFAGIEKWLNTDSALTIQSLRGRVVLVDFWTYTCINCIRTLPHITSWYEKYKDKGFVVVGVHTPEFQFEHNADNVLNAANMYGIHYPIAQDNDYKTWNNYQNEYWPAEYLIDAKGRIRRTHFGEGEYDEMEMAIRELLQENGKALSGAITNLPDELPDGEQSPETYLGAARMEYFFPTRTLTPGQKTFIFPKNIKINSFSLSGEWNIRSENAVAGKNAELQYYFIADHVYLVLHPGRTTSPQRIKVLLDGKSIDESEAGSDVQNGMVTLNSERLYSLVNLHEKPGAHKLLLQFETPGIEAYAFTFG